MGAANPSTVVVVLVVFFCVTLVDLVLRPKPSLKFVPFDELVQDDLLVAELRSKRSYELNIARADVKELSALVREMRGAMTRHGFRCMPAINVATNVRLVVFSREGETSVALNPRVVRRSDERTLVHHTTAFGERLRQRHHASVDVEYVGEWGRRTTATLEGKDAECFQSAMVQFNG